MTGRILVTGASGFLGSHLVRALLLRGTPVLAASRGPEVPVRLRGLDGPLEIVSWDPRDPEPLLHRGVSVVVHLAACYGRAGEPPMELVEANLLAGLRLLHGARAAGVGAFLHAGTGLPPEVSPYALSKRQFAAWAEIQTGGTAVVELRFEHFFGAGDDPSKFTTHVARSCLLHLPRLPLTAGIQLRDFIHVDDAVAAIIAVLDRGIPPGGHARYGIGSGQPVSIRSLVERIHQLTGSRTVLDFGALAPRSNEPAECRADLTALRGLGWAPAIPLDEGLARFIDGERIRCAS